MCACVFHIDQQLREDVVALLDPDFKQEFSELEVKAQQHMINCVLGPGHDIFFTTTSVKSWL